MLQVWYSWTTIRKGRKRTPWGCSSSQTFDTSSGSRRELWVWIQQNFERKDIETDKTSVSPHLQFDDVQTSCTWWLCACNSDIWDVGWVYYTNGKLLWHHCDQMPCSILTGINQGELEHRRLKRFYPRIHKGQFTRGITKQQQCERLLSRIREIAPQPSSSKGKRKYNDMQAGNSDEAGPSIPFEDTESLMPTPPDSHHHISRDVRHKVNLLAWLGDNRSDPTLEVILSWNQIKHRTNASLCQHFGRHLKEHLLHRLGYQFSSNETLTGSTVHDRSKVQFINNRIFKHKVMRVNYTTYDLRRAQDSLNSRTHADFMTLQPPHLDSELAGDQFPYRFGRIIGIFHAMVLYNAGPGSRNNEPQHMEFLFVRWFTTDDGHRGGWKLKQLHRIKFVDQDDDAFGFLDPQDIIRGVHLIPAFHHGRTSDLLSPSLIARPGSDNDEDWKYFYVNMWVAAYFLFLYHIVLLLGLWIVTWWCDFVVVELATSQHVR